MKMPNYLLVTILSGAYHRFDAQGVSGKPKKTMKHSQSPWLLFSFQLAVCTHLPTLGLISAKRVGVARVVRVARKAAAHRNL
jgi:hypothetical protein